MVLQNRTLDNEICIGPHSFATAYNNNDLVLKYYGVMFELISQSPITIRTLEMDVNPGDNSDLSIEVYSRVGQFQLVTNAPEKWELVARTQLISLPERSSYLVPVNHFAPLIMGAGERRSFYLTMNGPYIDNTVHALSKTGELSDSNNDIQLLVGSGFQDTAFAAAADLTTDPQFAGVVHYDKQVRCESLSYQTMTVIEYHFGFNQAVSDPEKLPRLVDGAVASALDDLLRTNTMLKSYADESMLLRSGDVNSNQLDVEYSCPDDWSDCPTAFLKTEVWLTHLDELDSHRVQKIIYSNVEPVLNSVGKVVSDVVVYYVGQLTRSVDVTISLSGPSTSMNGVQAEFFSDGTIDFLEKELSRQHPVLLFELEILNQNGIGSTRGRRQLSTVSSTVVVEGRISGSSPAATNQYLFGDLVASTLETSHRRLLSSLLAEGSKPGNINGEDFAYFETIRAIEFDVDVNAGSSVSMTQDSNQKRVWIIVLSILTGLLLFVGIVLTIRHKWKEGHAKKERAEIRDKMRKERRRKRLERAESQEKLCLSENSTDHQEHMWESIALEESGSKITATQSSSSGDSAEKKIPELTDEVDLFAGAEFSSEVIEDNEHSDNTAEDNKSFGFASYDHLLLEDASVAPSLSSPRRPPKPTISRDSRDQKSRLEAFLGPDLKHVATRQGEAHTIAVPRSKSAATSRDAASVNGNRTLSPMRSQNYVLPVALRPRTETQSSQADNESVCSRSVQRSPTKNPQTKGYAVGSYKGLEPPFSRQSSSPHSRTTCSNQSPLLRSPKKRVPLRSQSAGTPVTALGLVFEKSPKRNTDELSGSRTVCGVQSEKKSLESFMKRQPQQEGRAISSSKSVGYRSSKTRLQKGYAVGAYNGMQVPPRHESSSGLSVNGTDLKRPKRSRSVDAIPSMPQPLRNGTRRPRSKDNSSVASPKADPASRQRSNSMDVDLERSVTSLSLKADGAQPEVASTISTANASSDRKPRISERTTAPLAIKKRSQSLDGDMCESSNAAPVPPQRTQTVMKRNHSLDKDIEGTKAMKHPPGRGRPVHYQSTEGLHVMQQTLVGAKSRSNPHSIPGRGVRRAVSGSMTPVKPPSGRGRPIHYRSTDGLHTMQQTLAAKTKPGPSQSIPGRGVRRAVSGSVTPAKPPPGRGRPIHYRSTDGLHTMQQTLGAKTKPGPSQSIPGRGVRRAVSGSVTPAKPPPGRGRPIHYRSTDGLQLMQQTLKAKTKPGPSQSIPGRGVRRAVSGSVTPAKPPPGRGRPIHYRSTDGLHTMQQTLKAKPKPRPSQSIPGRGVRRAVSGSVTPAKPPPGRGHPIHYQSTDGLQLMQQTLKAKPKPRLSQSMPGRGVRRAVSGSATLATGRGNFDRPSVARSSQKIPRTHPSMNKENASRPSIKGENYSCDQAPTLPLRRPVSQEASHENANATAQVA